MSDLALAFDARTGAADLCFADGDLLLDDGLQSLALASLLTEARASKSEAEPGMRDLRGWWGDALEPSGVWGGKLWLLERSKTLPETMRKAEDYARDHLAWMITDGIAADVVVTASRNDTVGDAATLALQIIITRPSGEQVNLFYDRLWRATAHEL